METTKTIRKQRKTFDCDTYLPQLTSRLIEKIFILIKIFALSFRFQVEDYIDEILNYDSITDAIKYEINSVTDARIKQEPQSLTDAEKDRQKKDNHNMSK